MWLGSLEGSEETPCGIKWVKEVYSLGLWFSTNLESGANRNFAENFDKFCRALNMWKGRELSIKGKITVIKNIAMPILLYVTFNLPIPEWLVERVTQKAYQFIWNDKPDKVSRLTLTAQTENGGMRMINFETMFKAQKVMWVKRLFSSRGSSWQAFPLSCMAPLGMHLFKCSSDPGHLPVDLPVFYHQVLYAWAEFKQTTEAIKIISPWEIRRESLFFNKNIQIDHQYVGKSFMLWLKKGVFLIHDILDEKGAFLKPAALENMYGIKIDALSYNGLKDAIPREWRHLVVTSTVSRSAISSEESPFILSKHKVKPLSLLSNKEVYCIMTQSQVLPKCTIRWAAQYSSHTFNWTDIFSLAFKIVRCTKVQTFQYQILHRYFPCNYWLSKWESNTAEICSRCKETDTLDHFFYKCETVLSFWKSFTTWWLNCMNESVHLLNVHILFGYYETSTNFKAVNFCILHAKRFIANMKYQEIVPYFYAFLVRLKQLLLIEKCICSRNGDTESFNKDFQKLVDAVC